MLPLVSVIIPVYNVEKYIDVCVNSVLNQTYNNLEIILVDDGSTDLSGEKCDRFAVLDKRVTVVHQENEGSSSARNKGLEMCKGEYISFIDSDDYFSKYFIEILMKSILKYNVKMALLGHGVDFWDNETNPKLQDSNYIDLELQRSDEVLMRMLYYSIPTGVSLKICNKEIWENVRFPLGYPYEDLATTYKLIMQCRDIIVINNDLYAYRKRKDSNTRSKFSNMKMLIINISNQLICDVTMYNKDLENAAISRAFSAVFSVYLQVPFLQKNERKELWKHIIKYRKTVINDKNPLLRSKCKYAAYISFLGQNFSWFLGRRFGQKSTIR